MKLWNHVQYILIAALLSQKYMHSVACIFLSRQKHANPEELEYLACQQEMDEDLHNQYCQVERVIRTCLTVIIW